MSTELQNGWITYIRDFIDQKEAERIYEELLQATAWMQGNIKLFGKVYQTPRKEAFYSLNGEAYGYSGQRLVSQPFTPLLFELKKRIELHCGQTFNSVLINLYRDGQDSNGWHADNEPELGKNPLIASLSFGAERNFDLQHQLTKEKIRIVLHPGSLLIMGGELQHFWKHQIPKSKAISTPRINLTFRKII
jgi:alkylated DNA repair dioxygenase AlkB